jgi:hypothetical protein
MTANPRQPLELVEGLVEQTNSNGVRINGTWFSRSQYKPIDLPGVGARVCLRVDAKRFISSVEVLEHGAATASLSRNETITRLAVLKAAAQFGARRPDCKSSDVLVLAEKWLEWVERAP